jgi:hypothetical protein
MNIEIQNVTLRLKSIMFLIFNKKIQACVFFKRKKKQFIMKVMFNFIHSFLVWRYKNFFTVIEIALKIKRRIIILRYARLLFKVTDLHNLHKCTTPYKKRNVQSSCNYGAAEAL